MGFLSDRFDGRLEFRWIDSQDRVAENELPTDDYFMLNLRLAYRPMPEVVNRSLTFDVLNLTDEEARNHISYLKGVAPFPERDFRFSMRFEF